ncbi:MAG TPA: hypothetical protein ENK70_01950, partial [Methylophaga sp.]|nr:hypothetical protein [Methylophaga sp.]
MPILGLAIALTFILLGTYSNTYAATTTPGTIAYQARLLNSSNVPLTGSYSVRFSLWSDADFSVGVDVDGAGAIVIAAPGYAGWQETQTVTTDTYGLFDVAVGSVTPLPNFTNGTHDFLQVEVKPAASPAT